ncbi:hypothetical protein [Pseudomonas phage PA1C]|uniref:Uncharacterized protein n=1 Tax=Pseudomonas phage vB_PaeM_PS119XW TaxID=2601632 RepID=A0A5C1K7E1_9CAUD|nr:hypothetical protein PP933_gp359 [Pseudomonas phage vB_PaeM_PS119XW]QBX32515.1 hypothetical protein [Pseudomonas phage PA1C]QEM42088.1 hypothetical protein [Pseudomonas phage vB_PaeM_PS119XW]
MKGQMHFAQAVFADQVVFFGRKDCGFNTHVVRFHENNDNTYHPPQEERKQKIKCIIIGGEDTLVRRIRDLLWDDDVGRFYDSFTSGHLSEIRALIQETHHDNGAQGNCLFINEHHHVYDVFCGYTYNTSIPLTQWYPDTAIAKSLYHGMETGELKTVKLSGYVPAMERVGLLAACGYDRWRVIDFE